MHVYCIHEDVSIYYLYFVKDFTGFVYSFFIDGRSSDSVQTKIMHMAFLNIQHAKIHIYVRAVAGLDPNQEQGLRGPPLFS